MRMVFDSSKDTPELTDEDLTERLRLERKVERGFYEAGQSLARIRDLELYRDRWRSFEAYVKDRFGWQRTHAYRQITAAAIFDELTNGDSSPNWRQLPTCESQVRPLAELKPEHRKEVWGHAVEDSNGRVPTQATVKKAVIDFQHTYLTDDKNPYAIDDIVSVKGKKGWWVVIDIAHSNCYCKNYCDDKEISTFDLEPVVLDNDLKLAAGNLIERLSDLWWRSENAPTADAIAIKGLVKAIATNPQATLSEAQSQLLDLAEILLKSDQS